MRKFLLVAVLLGAFAPAGAAFALDIDLDDAWAKAKERGDSDARRAQTRQLFEPHYGRPHDPRGIIVLEGAK
jgi:hypothetical protein